MTREDRLTLSVLTVGNSRWNVAKKGLGITTKRWPSGKLRVWKLAKDSPSKWSGLKEMDTINWISDDSKGSTAPFSNELLQSVSSDCIAKEKVVYLGITRVVEEEPAFAQESERPQRDRENKEKKEARLRMQRHRLSNAQLAQSLETIKIWPPDKLQVFCEKNWIEPQLIPDTIITIGGKDREDKGEIWKAGVNSDGTSSLNFDLQLGRMVTLKERQIKTMCYKAPKTNFAATLQAENSLIVSGGLTEFEDELASCQKLSLTTFETEEYVDFPSARFAHQLDLVQGCLFASGGSDQTNGMVQENLFLRDGMESWAPFASMSYQRSEFGSATDSAQSSIFAFFGETIGRDGACERYDPHKDLWTKEKRFPLFDPIPYDSAACYHNGRFYISGGSSQGDDLYEPEVNKRVFTYDPRAGIWGKARKMSLPRGSHSLISVNRRIYAIGGPANLGRHIEFYDDRMNEWFLCTKTLGMVPLDSHAVVM